jgi:hypothetical protein
VGAVSLTYTADQFGAHTTRATHPRALHLFQQLLSRALPELPLRVVNPLLWRTKGEAARLLLFGGSERGVLRSIARRTVSCDRVSWMTPGISCGRCR